MEKENKSTKSTKTLSNIAKQEWVKDTKYEQSRENVEKSLESLLGLAKKYKKSIFTGGHLREILEVWEEARHYVVVVGIVFGPCEYKDDNEYIELEESFRAISVFRDFVEYAFDPKNNEKNRHLSTNLYKLRIILGNQ